MADSCTICHADFAEDPQPCHTLECGHKFHTDCIVRWFREGRGMSYDRRGGVCPLCRQGPYQTAVQWERELRWELERRITELERAVRVERALTRTMNRSINRMHDAMRGMERTLRYRQTRVRTLMARLAELE